tara:strand:+ start:6693 stop:9374 length:2682 start_codon:yes stop_codon:yes gene_type:complete
MDYFNELLESYSKLKKRNLKLLEADKKKAAKKSEGGSDKEKTPTKVMSRDEARVAAWNAPAGPPFGTIAQVKNKEGVMRDVLAYKAQNKVNPSTGLDNTTDTPEDNGGHVVAANVTKTGNKATIMDAKGNPTEQFEAWYMRNFPGEAEEGVVDSVSTEAEDRAGRQFEVAGLFDEDLNGNMVTMLERVTNMAEVAQTLGIEQAWMNPSRMGNYVTGGSNVSIEKKLSNGTIATIDDKGGFKVTDLAVSSNLELLKGATESMNTFLSFATNGDSAVTDVNKDKACRELPLSVRRVTGQKKAYYVFHSRGDQSEGIVMPKSDIFDFAAQRMEAICNRGLEQIRRGTEEDMLKEQDLADYRGTGLEVTFAAATFYSTIGSIESQGGDVSKARTKFGQYLRAKILDDLDKFEAAHKWAVELVESGVATTMDSHFIADALLDLGNLINKPEGLNEYLSTAMALEEALISTAGMYPDMSIPVGTTVGNGYKDDLKYVYFDHGGADSPANERAEEAVKQFGLEGGEKAIQTFTVSELKELNPELVQIYQDAYNLKDTDQLTVVGCSVKSYKKGESTKGGEFKTWKKRSSLVNGTYGGRSVAPGFELVTQKRLGFDKNPQLLQGARSYQTKLDDMYASMDSILPDASEGMVGPKGTLQQITFETALPIIQKKMGKLPVDSKERARIEKLFKGEKGINLKDKQTRLKFKEEFTRLMISSKQAGDCNSRGADGKLTATARDARANLAYTTQLCGGVLHDTVINKKLLEANKTLAGSHQKPINDSTLGIIAFDADDAAVDARKKDSLAEVNGAWDVTLYRGSTLRLKKRGTQKYVSLGSKRKKMDDGSVDTNTSALISSELQDDYLTLKKTLKKGKAVKDNLMMTYLKGQAKLLEQLLASQETN